MDMDDGCVHSRRNGRVAMMAVQVSTVEGDDDNVYGICERRWMWDDGLARIECVIVKTS